MIHYTNIRRIFFCMCGQWREFLAVGSHWRRSVYSTLEPGQRLWLFFFSHAELWCLGVWAVTARRDCRQGVVSLRSAFQILAVSRVSCWYPHSFLPSAPPQPGLPALLQCVHLWSKTSHISNPPVTAARRACGCPSALLQFKQRSWAATNGISIAASGTKALLMQKQ